MQSKKREAIMASLLKLLDERPLSRISVKDIVEDCGVNRNTFYYHFEDMPALVEAIIIDEVNRITRQYEVISSIEECFEVAMRLSMDHKRAVYHIYNSVNRDVLERSLMHICEHAATKFIASAAAGRPVPPEDLRIIIRAYKCECFGMIVDWLNEGMEEDAEARIQRLCALRHGATEIMLRRSIEGIKD